MVVFLPWPLAIWLSPVLAGLVVPDKRMPLGLQVELIVPDVSRTLGLQVELVAVGIQGCSLVVPNGFRPLGLQVVVWIRRWCTVGKGKT